MQLVLTDRPLPALPARPGLDVIDLSKADHCPLRGLFRAAGPRTPGRCVIRDDAVRVYPKIAAARRVLYVSRLFCGGYDLPMKTMLERAIPHPAGLHPAWWTGKPTTSSARSSPRRR